MVKKKTFIMIDIWIDSMIENCIQMLLKKYAGVSMGTAIIITLITL